MQRSATSPPRWGTVVAWTFGAILITAVAAVAWIGIRGALAYSHLQSAQAGLISAAQAGNDTAVASAAIQGASQDLDAAQDLTSDPLWRAAQRLPWIGPQLRAVGTVTAVGADLADSALEPLSALAGTFSLSSLRPVNGALDLAALTAAQEPAAQAAAGLESAGARLAAIDRAPLMGPVSRGIEALEDQIATASATARAAKLLPAMLGADSPRTWLLLFQNNAELRSLGGMPGATAIITAEDGHLTLAGQGDAVMPRFDEPVIDLGPELTGIYGTRPAVWFSGTTILPDFAKAAPMAREMWHRQHGVKADGVISLDPIALSYMLRATGPITLPTGEVLTSDNAVDVLLNEVYLKYPDPVDQNLVFASASAALFTAFTSGAANPLALLSSLGQSVEERRLLLWSSEEDEQALFVDTALAGGLPESDADTARFGVYLNDGTGSKLGYYLDVDADVAWNSCTADGKPADNLATLTLNLTNTAPADAATSLPAAIAGGNYGVPAGTLRVVTYVYLPAGATLAGAGGSPSPAFGGGGDSNYRVVSHQVDLTPGGSSTIWVTADLPHPHAAELGADVTPAFGSVEASSRCAGGE